MTTLIEYIESGVLEMYVLGETTAEETKVVEEMANIYPIIFQEIDKIRLSLESYAFKEAKEPSPTIKPFLMATIDYMERRKSGEPETFPPILDEKSTIEMFAPWLERADMVLPYDFSEYFAKIIGHSPTATTAIVWIEKSAPEEIHDNELEKFLIIEGSCDIMIGNNTHQLIAGDYLSIPLHIGHKIKITSRIPCKVILQRIQV